MNIGKPIAVILIEPIRLPVPDSAIVTAKPAATPTADSPGAAS